MNTVEKNITNNQLEKIIPAEILSGSNQEKINYFRNLRINHPILNESFEELWESVKCYNDGSLLLLFGPTGVGKTTIMQLLEKRLLEDLKSDLLTDREMIPLVKAEVMGASNRKFDWKEFYREILKGLGEFNIDNRIDLNKWENPHQPRLPLNNVSQPYNIIANDPQSTESRLRISVEQALKHRRPKVVLLDEAQHFIALSTGRTVLDQQNVIKSLANRTQTTHALFGSYELMSLRDLNGQLARRTVNIHFRRYVNTSQQDMEKFENVIWNFQSKLPLEEGTNLISLTKYLYEGCFGCIGILKDWILRALIKLFSEQGRILTKRHLEMTKLDDVKLLRIAQECINGERKLREEKVAAKSQFYDLLGYSQPNTNGIKVIKNYNSNRKNNTAVGIRKPFRDEVGLGIAP